MRFKLTPSLNDGKNDAPPYEVEVGDVDQLVDKYVYGELVNDHDEPFGVGFTLTIERIA
jgi:hypothetical protein